LPIKLADSDTIVTVGLFSLLASTDIGRFTMSIGSQGFANEIDKGTCAFDDTSVRARVINLSIEIESLIRGDVIDKFSS
jgi:hypothetical protein